MGSEQQPKNASPFDLKPKEPASRKTSTQIADFVQPKYPAQAEYLQKLRNEGIAAIQTGKVSLNLPESVAQALLPAPTLLSHNSPSPLDPQLEHWPSGCTYDGEVGMPISYGPDLLPICNAISTYINSAGSKGIHYLFSQYFNAITVDLGQVWDIFCEERSRTQDDQQLGWDDLLSGKESKTRGHSTDLVNSSIKELETITEVQKLEQEMTGLIIQLSTLNTELERVQVTHDLADTEDALATKTAEAKKKEDSEIGNIDTILAFGFSIATDPSAAFKTTVTEVGKAIVKPAAKTLHTHLLKTEDLERLQAEVARLSKQRDRLKSYSRALETEKIQASTQGISRQIEQLTTASITAHEAMTAAELASNSSVEEFSASIQDASEGLQTCGKKQKTCAAPQGELKSMSRFSDVREKVMNVSPRITALVDEHLALQQKLEVPTKARRGMAIVDDHGPKFIPKDPALIPTYDAIRKESKSLHQTFEFWAEDAECDRHNTRQMANHVRDHKGQKALIMMQKRFGQDLRKEGREERKGR
jgi:chaperonin cofactor prefoldin